METGLEFPPCSRYEITAGNDDRTKFVLGYALGLLCNRSQVRETLSAIARVHDHKGELVVLCRRPLPAAARRALQAAWSEIGGEPPESVSFPTVGSAEWESVWSARRFESDWKP